MKRAMWAVGFIVLVGLIGCSNPFPEDVGLYSVSRGTTPGTAVEIAVPFEADKEEKLDVFLESKAFSISMISVDSSEEYPTTCSASVDGAGNGMMECTVSDEGQTMPKDAIKIQMVMTKKITGEDAIWLAQDLIWWEIGTGKDPECLAQFGEYAAECGDAAKAVPNMNCMAKMKGSDQGEKEGCLMIREQCFEQIQCLALQLLGYSVQIGGAEDSYSSPELDLGAAVVSAASAEDGGAGSDGETNGGGEEGTAADGEPGDPAIMAGDAGCVFVPGAKASAGGVLALLLVSCALMPLVRGRRMRGQS